MQSWPCPPAPSCFQLFQRPSEPPPNISLELRLPHLPLNSRTLSRTSALLNFRTLRTLQQSPSEYLEDMRTTLSSIPSVSRTSSTCLGRLEGLVLHLCLFGNSHFALDCADHSPSSFGFIFPTLAAPSRSLYFRFTFLAPVSTFFPLSPFIISLPFLCFYFTVFLPLISLFPSLCQVHPSNHVFPFSPLPFL